MVRAAPLLKSYARIASIPTTVADCISPIKHELPMIYLQDQRIFQNIRSAKLDVGLGGLLELNFTHSLNCNHHIDPRHLSFTILNKKNVTVQTDSNVTGVTKVSCTDDTVTFQVSPAILNALQLNHTTLPDVLPTYSIQISPGYSSATISITTPKIQRYNDLSILLDAGSPCVTNIAMEKNSDVLVITLNEWIVPSIGIGSESSSTSGSSNDIASSLIYGTHFSVSIESGSTEIVSVGKNVQILDVLKVQGTKQQYAMRVKLDHGIRPTGNEVVSVVIWPSASTEGAPLHAGVQDLWNNPFCNANDWPDSILQIPVTLSRFPGVIATPLSIAIGEASDDGVKGYGAYVTVRLDTQPQTADVKILLSSSLAQQLVFSNDSIVFKHGENTWNEGIQIQINAFQDNVGEAEMGKSHSTQILFAIDALSPTIDRIYNDQLAQIYGTGKLDFYWNTTIQYSAAQILPLNQILNNSFSFLFFPFFSSGASSLPEIAVDIYDPDAKSIAPPQILEIRFHSSLTYLSLFFDAPTDGDAGAMVPCEDYLILPAIGEQGVHILGSLNTRLCTWATATEFRIYLGYGATIRANSKLMLLDNTV